MRHRKHRHTLGVTKEHRHAKLANLAAALFLHGRIETTVSKAKALRPFAERIITLAKEAQNSTPERAVYLRRQALARVRHPEAVRMLFSERVAEFLNRPGGYTRIYKIGPRVGDAAEMALIALIEASDEGYSRKRRSKSTAKPKPAAEEGADAATESAPAVSDAATATEEDSASEPPSAEETPSDETPESPGKKE